MISVNQLSIQFGGHYLFDNISFIVNTKDRIGLVGKNGAGKSTLLKILSGSQESAKGAISTPNHYTIGYLPQELDHHYHQSVFDEARKAFKEALELDQKIKELTHYLETNTDYNSDSYTKAIESLTEASVRFHTIEGDKIDAKVERMLTGLGFKSDELEKPLSQFSGGWKMRVELAKILLTMPDAVLLDEPTNHLDIESIQWLEDFLKKYPGAVVLVSHDRAFLDAVTNRTIEITLGKIEDYKASYSRYVELRRERREIQMASFKNQQKQIDETEKFIERFRYKASKANQVQSRIKQLDKIDRIEVEEEDNSSIRFRFPPAPRSGKVVVTVDHVDKSYGTKQILNNVNLTVNRGEKVAFVGRNGEGKSTLSKIIAAQTDYQKGKVELGINVALGYFAQNQSDLLLGDKTVFDTLDEVAKGESRTQVRSVLGSFLFSGDSVDKKVKVLSGGEKGRLAIARLLFESANLLILDEPTNHLDMRSKDILKEALKAFDGTLILVSHDREFLDGLCNKVFEFRDGKVTEHIGGIFEYLETRKLESLAELEKKEKPEPVQKPQVSQDKKPEQATEKPKKVNEQKIQKIEAQITEAETEVAEIESLLADSGTFSDKIMAEELLKKYESKKQALNQLLQEWEEMVS